MRKKLSKKQKKARDARRLDQMVEFLDRWGILRPFVLSVSVSEKIKRKRPKLYRCIVIALVLVLMLPLMLLPLALPGQVAGIKAAAFALLGLPGALIMGLGLANIQMALLGLLLRQETNGERMDFGARFTLVFLGLGLLLMLLCIWICQ